MNHYLSSASLKSMAKGQLLGKYGTLIGIFVIHIACTLSLTLITSIFTDISSIAGIIIYLAASFLISVFLGLFTYGEAFIYLKVACGQPVLVGDLFCGFQGVTNKVLKVQLVLAAISFVCTLPSVLFSLLMNDPTSLNPYFFLGYVVITLIFTVADIFFTLTFAQSFYLLHDFPDYTAEEALKKSVKLMHGSRGRLFYLYLSFLPLVLLSLISCGVALLWLYPYAQTTFANFYLDLMKKSQV